MHTQIVRASLHQMIDEIEDSKLLLLCQQLLEKELKKATAGDFFKHDASGMTDRAQAAIQSIAEGKARSIESFKNDVEMWKKTNNT